MKELISGLWSNNPATPEGKYLVKRRDGTVVEWPSFVLGAKDPAAPTALRAYVSADELFGMNDRYMLHIVFQVKNGFAYSLLSSSAPPFNFDLKHALDACLNNCKTAIEDLLTQQEAKNCKAVVD